MPARRHNPLVVAALLLAALACYADVPRMRLAASLGDTLHAARALDTMSRIRLAAAVEQPGGGSPTLQQQLDDSRRSLALVASTPQMVAAAAPALQYHPPTLAPDTPRDGDVAGFSVPALPGAVLWLDLPPPRSSAYASPTPLSRDVVASLPCARGPPRA